MDQGLETLWRLRSYRALNKITIPDWHPIPHIQDFTASVHGTTIFSKLDLIRAYHQIPVKPDHIPKQPSKHVHLLDYSNSSECHFCYAYIDDVLIASTNQDEHAQHLQMILERLEQYGVVINPAKCELGVTIFNFTVPRAPGRQGWHTVLEGESNSSPEFSFTRYL